jgi:hypothetical protein
LKGVDFVVAIAIAVAIDSGAVGACIYWIGAGKGF